MVLRHLLIGVLLIAAIGGAQRLIPDPDRIYEPIASKGTIKEEISAEPYKIKVDQVQTARSLLVEDFGDTERHTTQGIWVIIRATATATQESVGLGDVALRSATGKRYAVSDVPAVDGLDRADLEAGIPQTGMLAFELPAAEVQGSVLTIEGATYVNHHRRSNGALGPAIEVDLGEIGAPAGAITLKEDSGL